MLSPDQLNDMDVWILDFLTEHEWGTPALMRSFYIEEEEDITRQWVSARLTRLYEHGHIERVRPDHSTYRLVSDPRDVEDEVDEREDSASDDVDDSEGGA